MDKDSSERATDNNYESEEETSLPGNTDDEEDNETDLTTGHGTDAAFDNEDKEGDCDSDVDVEEEVSPGGREQDDTDAEYLDQSLQGSPSSPPQATQEEDKESATEQRKTEVHTCPLCLLSFTDLEELKEHQHEHSESAQLSCIACGTSFTSKRALDKHMLVDASILNQLLSSKEMVTLPDKLCRTVVDILAESVSRPGGHDHSVKTSHAAAADDEEKLQTTKEQKEEDSLDDNGNDGGNDYDDDDIEEAAEEEGEESMQPSEIEQDIEEAEEGSDGDQKMSSFPQPFLSSSLTDAPMTPSHLTDNDDSMTSQSHYSAEETMDTVTALSSASSSRRKKKRPMQVPRGLAAVEDKVVVKLEPEDDIEEPPIVAVLPHTDLSSLVCPMCGEVVSDKQKLSIHIAEHEKFFSYFCALCDANFVEGRLLEAHVSSCHHNCLPTSRGGLQCRMCGMFFKVREVLEEHVLSCGQAPSCVVCAETFESGPQLQKHYYSHSPEERASAEYLSCDICGEVFIHPKQLTDHQKSHGTSEPYICQECGVSFRHKKVLERHRQVHARPQDCRCELCGVQLLTRSGYIAHLRGHKNNESVESGLANQLLLMLKATSRRRRTKKGVKERVKEGDGDVKKDLTMDTMQFLKLVDEQSSEPKPPKKRVKRDMNFFKNRTHSCPFCEENFAGPDQFQEHVSSVHSDQAHFDECDICHRKFYGKEYLHRHRQGHGKASAETFPCDQCSKVFRRKFSLETHRKVHTFKKFLPCDICGEEFRFINEVEKHKYRMHKYDRIQNLFECNLCKVKFGTLSHLNVHCRLTHKTDEGQPFKCNKCGTAFSTCIELKQHIFGSHQAGPCAGQTIKQEPHDSSFEGSLEQQVQTCVKNIVRTLTPTSSGKQKQAFGSMKDEDDEEDEGEEDEVMGVEAYNRLTRQKMSHSTMTKRFVCETCHKCFATKSDLRTHIRTHTGETPYKCEYCDRAFKQRGHRKLHIQVVHTKEMPYTCELCGQGYPTRYRYQIHLKRHSGIKEHKCPYCDRAYYTIGKLNEHKRKNHKQELAAEQQGM